MIEQAITCLNKNEFEKAAEILGQLVKKEPKNHDAIQLLGVAKLQLGHPREAAELIKQAIALYPSEAVFHANLALAFARQNQHELAIKGYLNASMLNPAYDRAFFGAGNAYMALERYDEAAEAFKKALKLNPNNANTHNNLGNSLKKLRRWDEALAAFGEALRLNPSLAQTECNIANVYEQIGKVEEALKMYEELSARRADDYAIMRNHCAMLAKSGRLQAAKQKYEELIELNPTPDEYLEFAYLLLYLKEFERGWKYYENRFVATEEPVILPDILRAQKKWDGRQDLNLTLLVHFEQGNGDTLHFCRYLPLVAKKVKKLLFLPQKGLELLLSQSFDGKNIEIVNSDADVAKLKFDEYIPLLSIPKLFGTTDTNAPFTSGYLKADIQKVESFKKSSFTKDGFKVGLFWQGNPEFKNDVQRSIPLSELLPLLNTQVVQFYSLQKGFGEEQLLEIAESIRPKSLSRLFNDFADTAAAIECLDLVISVDTAVAHIAAALGKPTWLLVHFSADWRWGYEGETSYWYDSVTLFRQHKPNDWEAPVAAMLERLQSTACSF